MTLATATPQGVPSARIVLLKEVSGTGFVFYTNYQSRKGHELAANRHAALLFHWVELERQAHIKGVVDKVAPQESDDYYRVRPLGSRIGAWASVQSSVPSREALERKVEESASLLGEDPPRPPYWGATASSRTPWSSGRAGRADCTTGWPTGCRRMAAGAWSGCRPEVCGGGAGSVPVQQVFEFLGVQRSQGVQEEGFDAVRRGRCIDAEGGLTLPEGLHLDEILMIRPDRPVCRV